MTMSTTPRLASQEEVGYPESDGELMAENTLQYEWITTIKGGLDTVFRDDPNVFVAGDLLWYPVEGDNTTRMAPTRWSPSAAPRGTGAPICNGAKGGSRHRWSSRPSHPATVRGNWPASSSSTSVFGVEEYYIYDPDSGELEGWLRDGDTLRKIPEMNGWVSPRLGARFDWMASNFVFTTRMAGRSSLIVELTRQVDEQRRRVERLTAQL
jgi:hypothetical protein